MARDIAVAAVVAFSAGVMSGVVVTSVVAIRAVSHRGSRTGQSLDLLERRVRRVLGVGVRDSVAHLDGR